MATESQLEPTAPGREDNATPHPRYDSQSLRLPVLVPALLTGGLLWLCHFPMACGWLAWVALVPLLCLVRSPARPRKIYLAAWIGGLVFFVPVLQWMRVADKMMYFTWIALALYCSLYLPLAVGLLRRLDRLTGLPLVVTAPVVWTALEFLRAHFLTGFPWYFIGHTQHDYLAIIQVADLAGVYAVSFLVVAVNTLLFELLCTRRKFRSLFGLPDGPALPGRRTLQLQTGAIALLFLAFVSYGVWRLRQGDFDHGPRIALVQGNMGQGIRNLSTSPGGERKGAAETIFEHYGRLCTLAAQQKPLPELIIWPETSYPWDWEDVVPEMPPEQIPAEWLKKQEWSRELLPQAAKSWRTNLLLGLNCHILGLDGKVRRYNSAQMIESDSFRLELLALGSVFPQSGFPGNLCWATLAVAAQKPPPPFPVASLGGRYDKRHLVPFGEYVPLRDTLPWLRTFAPYDYDYSVTPGQQMTRFALGEYRFGVVICYEDTDPVLARQYVRGGNGEPPVDFVVNISNDGWFDGTSEHEEHLAICRFRAIECRRSVVRAVNMGISGVIDGNGHVRAPALVHHRSAEIPLWSDSPKGPMPDLPVSQWHEFKKVEAVIVVDVPIDRRSSLYAQWGDWLPWTCWGLIGLGLVGGWWRVRSPAAPR